MKRGLSFDPTINAGHLLTFAGFLLAGFAGWTTLDKRVVVLEEGRKGQEQVDRHQDLTNRETLAAGEVYAYPKPINLQPGDRVEALCSAAGAVNLLSSTYSSATTVAKGFSAKGAWSSAATYTTNDVTSRNGAAYGALRDNTNADPLTSPSDWALLLDSPRKVVMLAADVTNNNATANTMADVTGLSFAVTAGKSYRFKAVIPYTSAATTTGSRWAINGPATSALSYKSQYTLTATTETTNHVAAYDSPAAANATSLTTGNNAVIEGTLTASASGNVTVRFASEIASSAIVAKAGGFLEWEQLN